MMRKTAKKGAKAYLTTKGAKKTAKAARKGVKGWAIYRAARKAAPTRLLVALLGVAGAALGATLLKKRSGASSYAPPAYTPPPAQSTADHAATVAREAAGVNEGTPPAEATATTAKVDGS